MRLRREVTRYLEQGLNIHTSTMDYDPRSPIGTMFTVTPGIARIEVTHNNGDVIVYERITD
jgi:hypothetical protein